MIQPIRRQTRIPFLALVAVALAVFASISLARITSSSATRTEAAVPTIVRADIGSAERPTVQAPTDKAGCGAGAYVSGDMAGETSPTDVYAVMCGKP
ncbi:MAG TPA: hypothetical protein VKV73_14675 [Chloroflexota bacterium]|nr:hypothetical protein [Chloroflexota bacterium]